jgi:hypothetical protein
MLSADGNSQKKHSNQPLVIASICQQLSEGNRNITGVMIESHINEGRQDVPKEGPGGLKWGVSITDACVGWDVTVGMLASLNEVIRLNASLRCVCVANENTGCQGEEGIADSERATKVFAGIVLFSNGFDRNRIVRSLHKSL